MTNLPDSYDRPSGEIESVQATDPRGELVEKVHKALVDEINRQLLELHGRDIGLYVAQALYRQLDMEELAEAALDSFQDRVALEIAKGITKLKEEGSGC